MMALPPREHRLLIAIHGWSAVAFGLLLYVVTATGTVAVMAHEIGRWSSGVLDARPPLTRPLHAVAARILADTPADLHDTVDVSASAAGRLHVALRGAPGDAQRGIDVEVAPDGRLLRRREGLATAIADGDPESALSAFLIGLHVRLYVPVPWGYAVTGIAGLALLVAAVSGFAIHRHLIRDIFTLRSRAKPALAARDRHNLAGAWALPFALALAVTGCFFSFAASVGFPALAWVLTGGDQLALFGVISGTPPAADPQSAGMADLDAVVADAGLRTGTAPDYIRLAHPGRADARITVYAEAAEGDFIPETLVYDGVTGDLVARRPAIGRVPSLGGTLYGLMAPLHFGDFAGVASKAAWTALGFCCCVATLGGMRLWLVRRDLSRRGWAMLDRTTSVIGLGLPLAMAAAAAGFFLGLPDGTSASTTARGFVLGVGAAALGGIALPRPALDHVLCAATGGALLTLPVLRVIAGGPGWSTAVAAGLAVVPAVDVAVLLVAVAFLRGPCRTLAGLRRAEAVAGAR